MSTTYAPGHPDDDDRPDGGEVVPFPGRAPDDADTAPGAVSDTSYEVALDHDTADAPAPVDDGIGFVLDDEPDAYPVIPDHLRTLDGIRGTLDRHARRVGHRAAFHGVRAPWYAVLTVWWARTLR